MRLQSLVAAKTPAKQTGMQQYILMIDWPTMTNAPVIAHRASCCLTIEWQFHVLFKRLVLLYHPSNADEMNPIGLIIKFPIRWYTCAITGKSTDYDNRTMTFYFYLLNKILTILIGI